MVEEIIITPEKVRAYGNIILPKNSTDFTTEGGMFSYGTETVNGQNNTVYKLISGALFYDSGITPTNNTEDWYYSDADFTLTVGANYSTVTYVEGTTAKAFIANKHGTTGGGYDYAPPFSVEFDLLGYTADTAANIQVYDGTRNAYRSFTNMGLTNNELHHIRVLALSDKVEFYADGELKYTADYTMSTSRTALRLGATGNYISFRNFTVRQLE